MAQHAAVMNEKYAWAEKEVLRYQQRIAKLERNGPQLKWIWIVGLPVSLVAGFFGFKFGVIAFGTTLCFAFTGRYFFFIQQREAEDRLRGAEADLAKYSAAMAPSSEQTTGVS